MHVIGISGSPVKGGNTETAIEKVLDGARRAGAQTELVRLYELDFGPCDGCDTCEAGGDCVIDDDATALIERLRAARAVVFGTPVYWYHVSGVMKNLIDRTYVNYQHQDLVGKLVVAIVVQHCEGAEETVPLFRHWCEGQGCTLLEAVTVTSQGRPDVVSANGELVARLSRLGQRLAG